MVYCTVFLLLTPNQVAVRRHPDGSFRESLIAVRMAEWGAKRLGELGAISRLAASCIRETMADGQSGSGWRSAAMGQPEIMVAVIRRPFGWATSAARPARYRVGPILWKLTGEFRAHWRQPKARTGRTVP